MFAALTGCSKKNKLTVWSFTDELGVMIENYYKPAFPNVIIDYTLIPIEQFTNNLDSVLASDRGVPDVFILDAAFAAQVSGFDVFFCVVPGTASIGHHYR
jgi:hypothetical protein